MNSQTPPLHDRQTDRQPDKINIYFSSTHPSEPNKQTNKQNKKQRGIRDPLYLATQCNKRAATTATKKKHHPPTPMPAKNANAMQIQSPPTPTHPCRQRSPFPCMPNTTHPPILSHPIHPCILMRTTHPGLIHQKPTNPNPNPTTLPLSHKPSPPHPQKTKTRVYPMAVTTPLPYMLHHTTPKPSLKPPTPKSPPPPPPQ